MKQAQSSRKSDRERAHGCFDFTVIEETEDWLVVDKPADIVPAILDAGSGNADAPEGAEAVIRKM